ncbi:MAG: 3-isopropylmalate dehydrogenase [Candidatus Acidiferrales bacterium]
MPQVNSPRPPHHKKIAVIPGDGIGKEVTAEAVTILQIVASAGGKRLELVDFDWGADRYLRDGTTLPDDAPEMFRKEFDAIFFGALGDPRVPSNKHAADILLGLRFKLDLYVNIRPCMLLDPGLTPLKNRAEKDIRFVVFRENTEGLYAGVGGFFKRGTPDEVAVQEEINTRKGVERIQRYAFEFARSHKLERLCMSDKSNALTYGHDLWQRVFAELKQEYPDIKASHQYIDNLLLQMVRDPAQFQVVVTCNLFGDIASDLGAGLIGGLGLAPSANINPEGVSLFEPVHGSAPNLAGKDQANPMGSVMSAAMMLDHLGWTKEAEAVEASVRAAIRDRKTTPDLGGACGTRQVGAWLAEYVVKHGVGASTNS